MLVLRHAVVAHMYRMHRPIRAAATIPRAMHSNPLIMLGIESSCDDTGVAVVNQHGEILGEAIVSQVDIHAPWGGVVPKLAQQAHADAMDAAVHTALTAAGIAPHDLSAVAVTIGPGLSLCLHVGVAKAHALCRTHTLPLVPIHHMEAHALVARAFDPTIQFPFLCLLVSGGHNLLLLVHGVGRYTQLGTTLDDALGEAYDKVARLLGLPLAPSGGAALEQAAKQGDAMRFALPLPLKRRVDCNFSYAGLKTAVRLLIEEQLGGCDDVGQGSNGLHMGGDDAGVKEDNISDNNKQQIVADIAASFQRVAVDHLSQRTARGIQWAKDIAPDINTLVVAGGVAANATVRGELQAVAERAGLSLVCPPPRYCTDNGVMVAWGGVERYQLGLYTPAAAMVNTVLTEDEEWLELRPRWPLTSNVDSRGMPPERSARKKRLHTDLTSLTLAQLAGVGGGDVVNAE